MCSGLPCALNVLESDWRAAVASHSRAPGAFSAVLDLLMRHTIPGWVLDALYGVLGVVLLLLIFLLPPRFQKSWKW